MKAFAALFTALDQTTKTNDKVEALVQYFAVAPPDDKLWTIALLSHRRPKRSVTTTLLRQWAAAYADVPRWLFEECYHVVGDLAETIALVLPPPTAPSTASLSDWIAQIRGLAQLEEAQRQEQIYAAWRQLSAVERLLYNKLITGGFRVGVSQQLMVKALAQHTGVADNVLAHRLMGNWSPDDTEFAELVLREEPRADRSKPYPFYLAYPLEADPATLGDPAAWQAEYKWDGIRGQLIVRGGELFVWTRGEELVTTKFPEFLPLLRQLPDGTVLDGEILPFANGQILPFQVLQTRIGRKNLSKNILQQAPVVLRAYDLLELAGVDWRERPLSARRTALEALVAALPPEGVLQLSPLLSWADWTSLAALRAEARAVHSEGLMLKRRDSTYRTGRRRGDWWKWKLDPYTIDAVMIYAQQGHGRRANLYTDFTFAVWHEGQLVPFTKAYSGLTDAEFRQVNTWIRAHTVERFGPVRSVQPELVFEIAFEGIQVSTRHKSGLALRFPRIARWRTDKTAAEADHLEHLQRLLAQQ